MKEDALGHLHPSINEDICVDCGLCRKSCPVNVKPQLIYPLKCYAVAISEDEDLFRSASGGAATLLMRSVISSGGVVYGCSGKDIFNVHHIRVDKIQDIEELRGSKYVQSNVNYSYREVWEDLKTGRDVLFIGTPCQVVGLKTFLHRDYPNLVTADLVCHGVPSQKMLTENIGYYTNEIDGKKINVAFRRKSVRRDARTKLNSCRIEYGWYFQHQPYSSLARKFYDDSYVFAFLQCLTFRESCYTCRYSTSARCSDVTLADFWGLGNDTQFEKGKGVSLCLVNSAKGQRIVESLADAAKVVERDVVEAIMGNGQLQCPSMKNKHHEEFRYLYPKVGLKESVKRILFKERLRMKVWVPFKKQIKRIIRRN